tara:strand:+ start:81 stop:341 length:261 start_codon:yes stop_codon:yes gene_type:complete
MSELLNQMDISGIGALACLVAAFLFKMLGKQVKDSTAECRLDRKILREKIDVLIENQTALEVRTARAEILASIPCAVEDCPKRGES